MAQKDLGADDHNKEKKKSYGDDHHPKTLVLKWGNHRHRVPISLAPPDSSPEPEPEPEPVPVPVPPPRPSSDASLAALPWNLRDRSRIYRPKKLVAGTTTSTPNTAKKEPMRKLAVSLSESEIMEDFLKMTGKMPPSRPKKRVRAIQLNLDTMNFGHDLAEISSDRYHVWEPFPTPNKMSKKKICHKKQLPN